MYVSDEENTVQSIVNTLKKKPSILFVTGAGISADSGLPTYRGVGGLYNIDDTEEGFPIETILSGGMFQENPALTWKYLMQIADSARSATFNRGHEIIAEFEKEFPRVWTLTQNIDGFHLDAGSRNVIEIHGNMNTVRCVECQQSFSSRDFQESELPQCPHCEGLIRPNVVLFDEMLPENALARLRSEMERGFGIVFVIGTTAVFPYINAPVHQANQFGNPTVEINPAETSLSHSVDYRLPIGAKDALEMIWEKYQQEK